MHTKTNCFAVFWLIVVCFLCSSNLTTHSASAVSASITTNNNITLNASTASDGVTIDEESISITTTCDKGYDLTIATSTSTNLYLNGDSTSAAAYTAVDGTSALNSTNNTNKWGYTTTSNPTSSTIFSPLSTTASTIRTIAQTTSLTSETIPIYYGIKTDNTIDPGTYSMGDNGVITYYLTMNPLCYIVDIAYDGNNADAGTMGAVGTGVIHTGVTDGDTVNLIASNFSRDGYGFAGWSLDPNAGTKLLDNDNTNNPIVYGPQETITLPEGFADNDTDNDGIVTLYAVWLQSQGNLQGWMGCSSLDTATYDSSTGALDLTKNSVTALTDQRDNDTYAIAKLADGNCWMIENLRLDNTNSDNSTGALAQGYGTSAVFGNFGGLADAESTNFTDSTAANSLYYSGTQSGTASINIDTTNFPGYRMPRHNTTNTSARASSLTNNDGAIYSYGNYYTWSAAIADPAYHGDYNQSIANTSLCPTGWHLPTGGNKSNETNNELWSLVVGGINNGVKPTNYSSSTQPYYNGASEGGKISRKLRTYPNNLLYSGTFDGSSASGRGSFGNYWSSTSNDYFKSYILNLGDSRVTPGTYHDAKYLGYSIRCIATDPVDYTLTYDVNGGSGTPSSQSTTANGITTFTVSDATPTRPNYTFVGWIDEKGNEVQPGESFTTKDPNAVLYAIWTNDSCNPTATTIGTGNTTTDAVCLQDVTPSMKASLPVADATIGTYTLVDARDGQSYTIAKLPDNNLWMTKNLNYSSTNANTPYDTDVSGAFSLPQSTTTSNTDFTIPSIRTTNGGDNNDDGAYYSWAAAIANTNRYSNSNVTSSICPKGWDLPIADQYENLDDQAHYTGSSNPTTLAPSSFLIHGGFTDGSTFYNTNYSHFWTSTSSNVTNAYGAKVYSFYIMATASSGTSDGGNKYYRKNVRCIANNGTATINYDSNGTTEYPVTGLVTSQTNAEINATITQAGTGFIRTGWAFNGWNTAADGSGTAISAGAPISNLTPAPGSTITLYAQWIPQYTITYVNNCQTYASANSSCTQNASDSTSEQKINLNASGNGSRTLAAYNEWTLTGWKITGWTTNADGTGTEYDVSSTFSVTNQSAGSGITLYAHWVRIYSVQYDGNGAGNPDGMGTTNQNTGIKTVKQTNVGEGDLVVLLASNFKKAGNGFAGWSTDSDAWAHFTDDDNTNDPVIYGPMETITAPAYPDNGTNIITMYAVWVPAEKDGDNNLVYLQDFTASDCNALAETVFNETTGVITPGGVIALTDKRDDEVYTVARLADGRCWMTENLRLEREGTIGNNKNDSSVTNQDFSQGYGGIAGTYGNFVGLANPESSDFTKNSTTPNTVYKSDDSGSEYDFVNNVLEDIGTSNFPAYRFPRYNNINNSNALSGPTYTENYSNAANPSASGSYKASAVSSYGNYYTWAAAMANTTHYTSPFRSEGVNTSICPVNWHLPSSGMPTDIEFGVLSQSYGGNSNNQNNNGIGGTISNRFRAFPNNFLLSGYFSSSSTGGRGSEGYYWSGSAYSNESAYDMSIGPALLNPADYFMRYKYYGYTVRCLLNHTYTVQYDANGADNPNGMGTIGHDGKKSVVQVGMSEGATISLLAPNFKRTGYGFAGWSTDADAWAHFTDDDNTNDPIIFGPMEDMTIDSEAIRHADANNVITMHAIWIPAEKDINDNPIYLQEWDNPEDTTDGCAALSKTLFNDDAVNDKDKIIAGKDSVIALTDKRDNQVYAIARLADGNCWMVENLRLEREGTIGNNTIDPSVTNESLSQGYGKYTGGTSTNYGSFIGLAEPETAYFRDSTPVANSVYYSGTQSGTATENIGTNGDPGFRMPRYNNNNTASTIDNPTYTQYNFSNGGQEEYGSFPDTNVYSYGNYYTWPAAMATTKYYGGATGAGGSESANTSICPTGWHLPSAGDDLTKEYSSLSVGYGGGYDKQYGGTMSKRFRSFPNNFIQSGFYNYSYSSDRGEHGYYWGRSASSYADVRLLDLTHNIFDPSGGTGKGYGLSVRCLINP